MDSDLADTVPWAIMYASTLSPHLRALGVRIDTHSLDTDNHIWRQAFEEMAERLGLCQGALGVTS